MSTGIATLPEIEEAVAACRRVENNKIILLKCTSAYPAPPEEANILTIPDISQKFKLISGLSDHTIGSTVAIAAVALGARVIEKHFILDRNEGGPDAAFSMNPDEFRQMVDDIRIVEKALGKVNYELTEKTVKSRVHARSLFVCQDVKAGQIITTREVRSIRPGAGLHPRYLPQILGKKAKFDLEKGTPFSLNMVE